jgi:hypothetical protein
MNMEEKIIDLVKKIGEWDGFGNIYYIDAIRISPSEEILSIGVYEQFQTDEESEEALLACVIDDKEEFKWLYLFGELDKYYKDAFDKIMDEFNGILNNIGNITKIK